MRRRLWSYVTLSAGIGTGVAFGSGVSLAGCGSSDNGAQTEFDATSPGNDGNVPFNDDGGIGLVDATGSGQTKTLTIAPLDPTVDVMIQDGVVTTTPLTFTAYLDGNPTGANFLLDRSELGSIVASTGVFTASGELSGVGHVQAQVGNKNVSTSVTVRVKMIANGAPAPGADAGADGGSTAGGVGGVGGEGLGGKVDPAIVLRLTNGPLTAPASKADLGWLYPYDKTLWPRGMLAPLLMWQTTHTASAVYIHLKEKNFEFQGTYRFNVNPSATPAEQALEAARQPIDAEAWRRATSGNLGDPLHVEISIADANGTAYGPIAEDWTVAPGILRGTVYYNSYGTRVAGPSAGTPAGVLAIKPGAAAPSIAIASTTGKCHACHTVSKDGSTLILQEGPNGGTGAIGQGDYGNGDSYDLRNGGALINRFDEATTSSDGSSNHEKFVWAAQYPDGTFALSHGHHGIENQNSPNDSALFNTKDGSKVASTGFEGIVKSAVTPDFSADGKHVAFDFWDPVPGGDAGVQAGHGHTLAAMDFDCHPAAGSLTCGAPPYAFSNPRELARDDDPEHFLAWPSFLPDSKSLVFAKIVHPNDIFARDPATGTLAGLQQLVTWFNAQGELWWSDVPAAGAAIAQPHRLDALNGRDATGAVYLPDDPWAHDATVTNMDDSVMNYEPTVNPVASGGYYWVVFTSRRRYGNVTTGTSVRLTLGTPPNTRVVDIQPPWDNGNGTYPIAKKLWVAAIDVNAKAGTDPSHPAFYLPGQEINAGNLRGFWSVDPCKAKGSGCTTGDECCAGFCRSATPGGARTCSDLPAQSCSEEYEKCATAKDCCKDSNASLCLNGRCAQPTPH